VEIPDQVPPRAKLGLRVGVLVAVGLTVALVAGGALWTLRAHHRGTSPEDSRPAVDANDAPPPYDSPPAIAEWVTHARSATDPLARVRVALDDVAGAFHAANATLVTEGYDTPPTRSIEQIAAAVRSPGARVTSLDLARLVASIVRGAGSELTISEQTRALRPDEPVDPSAVLGGYTIVASGNAADLAGFTMVPARDLDPRVMDEHATLGAMLGQSAVSRAVTGDRSAARLAESAVRQWPDGWVPLAARAFVFRVVGASGGLQLALQDVSAATAARDSAPLHLLAARVAIAAGELARVPAEVRRARQLAPHWGPAAVAWIAVEGRNPDAGNPCEALASARDDWSSDAVLVCQHRMDAVPDPVVRTAAERLMRNTHDPLRLALATIGGAEGAAARVLASERTELAGWLALLGRPDLAAQLMNAGRDAGMR
jgi:hypothetical protein